MTAWSAWPISLACASSILSYRCLTIQAIYLVIYAIGALPIPVLPLLALTWGYLGVLAIGRAWVKNEKLRTSIAKKVVEIDPDSLPDFRLSALLAAVQLLVLFPMIFYQTYRTFGLYQLNPDEVITPWTWLAFTIDSYNKAFLGILDLYGILHNPKITPVSIWGKNLMLLARITFDWQLIQGGFRLLSIRETTRDAVTAIVRDPSMALAVGRRTVVPLISALEQDEPIIRIRAADVLGQLKDPDAVAPLIEVLSKDESPEVRAAAARSLGMLHAVEAKDAHCWRLSTIRQARWARRRRRHSAAWARQARPSMPCSLPWPIRTPASAPTRGRPWRSWPSRVLSMCWWRRRFSIPRTQ